MRPPRGRCTRGGGAFAPNGLPAEFLDWFLTLEHDDRARRATGDLTVVDCASGLVVGFASLIRTTPGVAVGIVLGPGGRGRGLGGRVLAGLCAIAGSRGVAEVVGGTAADNVAMQRTFERAGAVAAGTGPYRLPDGRIVDSIWYRLAIDPSRERAGGRGQDFAPAQVQGR